VWFLTIHYKPSRIILLFAVQCVDINFKFLISLGVWHDTICLVNQVSKNMETKVLILVNNVLNIFFFIYIVLGAKFKIKEVLS